MHDDPDVERGHGLAAALADPIAHEARQEREAHALRARGAEHLAVRDGAAQGEVGEVGRRVEALGQSRLADPAVGIAVDRAVRDADLASGEVEARGAAERHEANRHVGLTLGEILELNAPRDMQIDLRVGAPIYTHPYKTLVENSEADLFIILGVAHQGAENLFVASKKDFETPLGRVETDHAFIDEWSTLAGTDLTAGEFVHRTEHSVEFQIPFLQHIVERPFKIVPVLCGSIEHLIRRGQRPEENPRIAAMINGLKQMIASRQGRAMVLLSVDLAHMGLKFGDEVPITRSDDRRIREADMVMFDAVSRLDMKRFVRLMQDDLFPRKVDACASIYIMLSMMEEGRGEFLSYGQNFQPEAKSMVSYGSMAFWGRI